MFDDESKELLKEIICLLQAINENTKPKRSERVENKIDKTPYAQIMALYHDLCPHFASIKVLNTKRRQRIKVLMNTHLPTIEDWEGYFKMCNQDSWYRGHNPNNWRANLDFLLRENNVIRMAEQGPRSCPRA